MIYFLVVYLEMLVSLGICLKNDLYLSLWVVILEMKGSDWLILNDQSEMSMFLVFAGGVYKKPISLKISVVVC